MIVPVAALGAQQPTRSLHLTETTTLQKPGGEPLFQIVGARFVGRNVVVGEGSTGQLHLFSHSGQYLRSAGGLGSGPGEFRQLVWLDVVRGAIYTYDRDLRRLTQFDDSLHRARTWTLPGTDRWLFPEPFGVLADGSILATAGVARSRVPAGAVLRDARVVLRYPPSGSPPDSVASFVGTELYVEPYGQAGELTVSLPFGRSTDVIALADGFLLADNVAPVVSRFSGSGTAVATLRIGSDSLGARTSQGDIARFKQRARSKGEHGSPFDAVLDRLPLPERLPYFGWTGQAGMKMLRQQSDGSVWLLKHGGIRSESRTWYVLSGPTFTRVSPVEVTQRVDIMDTQTGSAIVLEWDEDEVESLSLRRLRFP